MDFLIGEADLDATRQSQTVDQPRTVKEPEYQTGTADLRDLAAAATKDDQQAQTLLEALTLLERDYEEELTASQVLDMSAMRAALGDDLDEPTQIRGPQRPEAGQLADCAGQAAQPSGATTIRSTLRQPRGSKPPR